MKQRILVVGGAGYVGSHVVKWLQKKGASCVTADNLSTGHRGLVQSDFIHLDLTDAKAVDTVFDTDSFDVVIHLAAKSLVGESVSEPALYYEQNVGGMLNLLTSMKKHAVKNLIFSSTCAVYSEQEEPPFTEESLVSPASCYGRTKLACEHMIRDFSRAYELNAVMFRYFNVAGADPDTEIGEWHDPETHLIPLCFKQILEQSTPLSVFGTDYDTTDGTCIRDYIHVNDIAIAHEKALGFLSQHSGIELFNLGTGTGLSVKQIIEAVESVSSQKLAYQYCERRDGDVPTLVANYKKAEERLGWRPSHSELKSMLNDAWKWHQKLHDRNSNSV